MSQSTSVQRWGFQLDIDSLTPPLKLAILSSQSTYLAVLEKCPVFFKCRLTAESCPEEVARLCRDIRLWKSCLASLMYNSLHSSWHGVSKITMLCLCLAVFRSERFVWVCFSVWRALGLFRVSVCFESCPEVFQFLLLLLSSGRCLLSPVLPGFVPVTLLCSVRRSDCLLLHLLWQIVCIFQ